MQHPSRRRYSRSSRELALDHMARAIRSATMAALSAERSSEFEASRQLEHAARQMAAQYELLSESLPALRTQSYDQRRSAS